MKEDMIVKLLVVQGRPFGKSLLFPNGDYYFGRGPECHVRPESEWVSRQHCLLRVTPAAVFVRDLGSRNGTLVNGALVEGERQLLHGDQVQIGPLVFELQMERDTGDQSEVSANVDSVTLGSENTAEMDLTQQVTSTLHAAPGGVDEPTLEQKALPASMPQPPTKSDPRK
jgi:pSer/pThr/pTyr-binding forkhead associated (FHA) protein